MCMCFVEVFFKVRVINASSVQRSGEPTFSNIHSRATNETCLWIGFPSETSVSARQGMSQRWTGAWWCVKLVGIVVTSDDKIFGCWSNGLSYGPEHHLPNSHRCKRARSFWHIVIDGILHVGLRARDRFRVGIGLLVWIFGCWSNGLSGREHHLLSSCRCKRAWGFWHIVIDGMLHVGLRARVRFRAGIGLLVWIFLISVGRGMSHGRCCHFIMFAIATVGIFIDHEVWTSLSFSCAKTSRGVAKWRRVVGVLFVEPGLVRIVGLRRHVRYLAFWFPPSPVWYFSNEIRKKMCAWLNESKQWWEVIV